MNPDQAAFDRPGYLRAAMSAGASGFLLKDASVAQLAAAIQKLGARNRAAVEIAQRTGWL